MKSLKVKLIVVILILVVLSTSLTIAIGLSESFSISERLIQTQVENQLAGANSMLKNYMFEQFGSLRLLGDGVLVDESGTPIDGRFEYLDRFAESMQNVATIFAKDGSSFVRVITTITDENGERIIGTELDPQGGAYHAVIRGESYLAAASILGEEYMTSYTPMTDENGQIIGVYFVGVPMTELRTILEEGAASAIRIVALITLLILLLAALIIIAVSGHIAMPIKKVTAAVEEIAEGNFDVTLNIRNRDETGHLAKAVQRTIERLVTYQDYIDEISAALESISNGDLRFEPRLQYTGQFKKLKDHLQGLLTNLNSILMHIRQSAQQVDSGAAQVAQGAQALSQGAAEQASSIQQLSASIAEMTEETRKNAENAKAARDKAESAIHELQTSNDQMKDMMSAMDQISDKSAEISKIIKMIDDIAFQTNILALNAAIEAARAGVAGKGFAVVADEVKNLAIKSADAAKDTTALIEDTVRAVSSGYEIANRTALSLEKSSKVTAEAVALIDTISEVSHSQATAIMQINQGVEQISSVVQTNVATAEQSAAASQELSSQSSILEDLIGKFKLKESAY